MSSGPSPRKTSPPHLLIAPRQERACEQADLATDHHQGGLFTQKPPSNPKQCKTGFEKPTSQTTCVCVCQTLFQRATNFNLQQGDWSRFAYPVQRSYGISVEEWSDQPLVPAQL